MHLSDRRTMQLKFQNICSISRQVRMSSSIIHKIYMNELPLLDKLFNSELNVLPRVDSLEHCLSSANFKLGLSEMGFQVENPIALILSEDPNGVIEEVNTELGTSTTHKSIGNICKYWGWRNREKVGSYLSTFKGRGESQCVVSIPVDARNLVETNFSHPYGDSVVGFHLTLNSENAAEDIEILEDNDDIVNGLRQLYWFHCSAMLLDQCRGAGKLKFDQLSVAALNEFLCCVYCVETILSVHQSQLQMSAARTVFADSVAVRHLVVKKLYEAYRLIGEPVPVVLKFLPNFYGNDDTLTMHSSKSLFKKYWDALGEFIPQMPPDHEYTNLAFFNSPTPDRNALLEIKKILHYKPCFSDKKNTMITDELKACGKVCNDIEKCVYSFKEFLYRTVKRKHDVIFFNHYLQKHILDSSYSIFTAICCLKRLNDSFLSPDRFTTDPHLQAERAWGFKNIEKAIMHFELLAYREKRSDIHYSNAQTKTQGKLTSDRRKLQFTHGMFPEFF